jgi:hypothetical protein
MALLTVLFAGNNKTYSSWMALMLLLKLTYGGGGTAPTITASNWQCASLNGITYFFQSGHDPLIYDPAVSAPQHIVEFSEKTGYARYCALAANVCYHQLLLVVCGLQIQTTDNVTV